MTWQARPNTVLRAGTPGAVSWPLGRPAGTAPTAAAVASRSRKCHVSPLRLRGRRLTLPARASLLFGLGCLLPAPRSRPHRRDYLPSAPRPSRGRWWAGENVAPGLGLDAPPSLLPAFCPQSFFPFASSSRLSSLRSALSHIATSPFQPG